MRNDPNAWQSHILQEGETRQLNPDAVLNYLRGRTLHRFVCEGKYVSTLLAGVRLLAPGSLQHAASRALRWHNSARPAVADPRDARLTLSAEHEFATALDKMAEETVQQADELSR